MRRQVGSVHLMGVEGAVRGQRFASGYRRLGWDAVSLGWRQRALSLVRHRLSCSDASYEREKRGCGQTVLNFYDIKEAVVSVINAADGYL